MIRSVLAVLSGAVGWAVLWLGSNAIIAKLNPETIREGEPITDPGLLFLLIFVSVVFSIAAGYLTGLLARRAEIPHVVALGILQLALGMFFQIQYWDLMPLWYHFIFLVLLLPGNVVGGVFRKAQKA